MSTTKRLIHSLIKAIPVDHNPHLEAVSIHPETAKELIDHLEWLEKGVTEWRDVAQTNSRHTEAARATARVAIGHLQAVLNKARTHDEQQKADTAARDWLISIGSEPS